MEEGAGRCVVEVGHGVRLVGRSSSRDVVVVWRGMRVVTSWVRTEPGRRGHAPEVRVVVQRIGRQQSSSCPTTAANIIQLLLVVMMFYVTSGSCFVHGGGGTVSGRRGGGSGNPADAFVGSRASADHRDSTATLGVRSRLLFEVGSGQIHLGRGGSEIVESAEGGAATDGDGGSDEGPGIEVDARRGGSASRARVADQEVTLTVNAVEF